jgi:hypothetical protein
MRLLARNSIPCWYELSWIANPPTLVVRIHEEFMKTLKDVPATAPIVKTFTKDFGFKSFQGKFGKDFGFEEKLLYKGKKDEFSEYHVIVPQVHFITYDPCRHCKGSGKQDEPFEDEPCWSCDGDGKMRDYRWHTAQAVSATLTLLFMLLDAGAKTCSELPQLMTVTTICAHGQHGGSLGGTYSRELVQWLSTFKESQHIPEMEQAMRTTRKHMLGLKYYEEPFHFRATVDYENGWLNVSIPGDACGLNPSDGHIETGRGYNFSCHNTDEPAQQLTLLCGLAALHDLARKKMK